MLDAPSVPFCLRPSLFFLCMIFSCLCGFLNPTRFWMMGCKMENNRVTQRFCSATSAALNMCGVEVLEHHHRAAAW